MQTCKLTCKECGLDEAKFFVRDRKPRENILDYIQMVRYEAQVSHDLRSPRCRNRTLDLYLPAENPEGIGFPMKKKEEQ
jgi:hypothetical protein